MSYTVTVYFDNMVDETHYFEKESEAARCYSQLKRRYQGKRQTFALAWIFGYEVEREKKYWVRDKEGRSMLYKSDVNIASSGGNPISYQKRYANSYTFTEQEIKDYDERYWAFAVEVEE